MKWAINNTKDIKICFAENEWEGWTLDILTNEPYNAQIIEIKEEYKNVIVEDFDINNSGSYSFNENKYLERIGKLKLNKLRNIRQNALLAFDKYNIAITRGIIEETNKEKTEMLNWYKKALDLDEESILHPPQKIVYYQS